MSAWRVEVGDCVEAMAAMPEASVDAIVTDPPYGLEFMGKDWDRLGATAELVTEGMDASHPFRNGTRRIRYGESAQSMQDWHEAWAREALRVLRPGGHLLAFGGTRTYHRLAAGIEDAGFEVRDTICWLYGSGFPKSLNVGCRCDRSDVRGVRDGVPDAAVLAEASEGADVLVAVQREAAGEAERPPISGGEHEGPQTDAQDARPGQPSVEGRRDPEAAEGQLRRGGASASAGVGDADGARGRLHTGAPPADGDARGSSADAGGSGASSGQPPVEQRGDELGTLADEPGSQAGRGWPLCPRCGLPSAGLGTALKPAFEPIVVARKPLAGTVAANVLAHGTGALNILGCRVETDEAWDGRELPDAEDGVTWGGALNSSSSSSHPAGRWPANVVLDEEAAALLDEQAPDAGGGGFCGGGIGDGPIYGDPGSGQTRLTGRVDQNGGASRFFYCAKAGTAERSAGLTGFQARKTMAELPDADWATATERRNVHPTVKPIELMRWLVRLVTPPGGTCLDPFCGSGTTGIAAVLEGFDFVGVEREPEYAEIAQTRIAWWAAHPEGVEIGTALRADARRREVAGSGQVSLDFDEEAA